MYIGLTHKRVNAYLIPTKPFALKKKSGRNLFAKVGGAYYQTSCGGKSLCSSPDRFWQESSSHNKSRKCRLILTICSLFCRQQWLRPNQLRLKPQWKRCCKLHWKMRIHWSASLTRRWRGCTPSSAHPIRNYFYNSRLTTSSTIVFTGRPCHRTS